MRKTIILAVLLCLTLCTAGCSPDQDEIDKADIEFHRITEAPLQQDCIPFEAALPEEGKDFDRCILKGVNTFKYILHNKARLLMRFLFVYNISHKKMQSIFKL